MQPQQPDDSPLHAAAHEEDTGFLKRFGRLVPAPAGCPPREESDADLLALEREFRAERRARIERELERLIDHFTARHPGMGAAILHVARQPLPKNWRQRGELPEDVALQIRPLRQELDVLDALVSAVFHRPLVATIKRALRRLIDEDVELVGQSHSWDYDTDQFWSNELVEQILSNLIEHWGEWLRRGET